MNETLTNWMTAIAAVVILTGFSYALDGPGAHEVEKAQAADLADAQRHAEILSELVRKCYLLRGPSAELLQIEGSDDYVCREGEVEPTPAALLQRYAQLGGGK